MEKTVLGRTGIVVTRLCVGTWQAHGWSTSNDEMFKRTLTHALDRGINFIDTAPAYGEGHSERLVGDVIAGRRDSVVVATKFHHTQSRPDQIEAALQASLRNLRTDYIDLYQQHWPPRTPPLVETIAALQKLRERGLIRAIGVSNWMEPEWQEIADPTPIDSLQPCYSLVWRSIEPTVLPLMRRHSIAVIPYSPLAQGILAGRVTPAHVPTDFRAKNRLLRPEFFARIEPILAELTTIARVYDKTPAQTALRWLLDVSGITAVIVGASNPHQVDENLGALDWRLSANDHARLDAISRSVSSDLQPHDTLWGWHPRGGSRR
jgi:aryl-alcohol dehydrogenase-like predicted oxidoreductase